MREPALSDDLLLEPLPIAIGVPLGPALTSRRRRVGVASRRRHRFVETTAATIREARSLPPWSGTWEPVVPSSSVAGFLPGFSRMIDVHPGLLDSLPDWWRAHARDGRVEITRRLFLEEPRRTRPDTWCMRGSLRSPWRARVIPIELWLWPRLDAWARLSVEPQRGVHVSRRYFSSGHRVLDTLSARLARELAAVSRVRLDR